MVSDVDRASDDPSDDAGTPSSDPTRNLTSDVAPDTANDLPTDSAIDSKAEPSESTSETDDETMGDETTDDETAGDVSGARAVTSRRRATWGVLVPLVTVGAGLMFAMSFRAAQGSDLRADRDLPALIMAADDRVAEKAQRLDALQKEVDSLSAASGPTDARIAQLTQRAKQLAPEAATTTARGPGLEVTLNDAQRSADSLPDGYTADDIVVHQQDVQGVVNALWASGATAMMIQDQRVISTSAVRCVGNTLILQGRVYAPPYTIKAIGNVDAMRAGLEADPTVAIYRQWVDAVGLGYDLRSSDKFEFPAYSGSVDLQHATPIG